MARYREVEEVAEDVAALAIEQAKKDHFTMTAKNPDMAEMELVDLISDWIESNMTQYDE